MANVDLVLYTHCTSRHMTGAQGVFVGVNWVLPILQSHHFFLISLSQR